MCCLHLHRVTFFVFAKLGTRENASSILEEYLESIGGRDKILEDSQEAVSKKKRGRPTAGTPTNGSKRAKRNESHISSTPPASALKDWKPPAGSWENDVESIDACHDEASGKLVVYITWKNKQKTQHDTKIVYSRCPQKVWFCHEVGGRLLFPLLTFYA